MPVFNRAGELAPELDRWLTAALAGRLAGLPAGRPGPAGWPGGRPVGRPTAPRMPGETGQPASRRPCAPFRQGVPFSHFECLSRQSATGNNPTRQEDGPPQTAHSNQINILKVGLKNASVIRGTLKASKSARRVL